MPQFLTNLQDRRTLKNLDNLELVGCSLSEEIRKEIEEINGRIDISSKNMEDIMKEIDVKEKSLRKTNNKIKTAKNKMNELSDRLGAKKYIDHEYRKLKKQIKVWKNIKREFVRSMSLLYTKLQEEKRKLKDAHIKQKSLYQTTKRLAKEREQEISFAKKIEFGKIKIENIDAIQNILNMIKENNGKLPEDIQADGAQFTMEDAFDVLNGYKTINELKEMEEQEQGQKEEQLEEDKGDTIKEYNKFRDELKVDTKELNKEDKEKTGEAKEVKDVLKKDKEMKEEKKHGKEQQKEENENTHNAMNFNRNSEIPPIPYFDRKKAKKQEQTPEAHIEEEDITYDYYGTGYAKDDDREDDEER